MNKQAKAYTGSKILQMLEAMMATSCGEGWLVDSFTSVRYHGERSQMRIKDKDGHWHTITIEPEEFNDGTA